MTLIAHISDIHFGAVDAVAADRLAGEINAASVDGVVVTGDLTQAGRKREFEAASEYLRTLNAPHLVVPGNHDVPVYNLGQRFADPWARYRRFINADLCPVRAMGDALVVGLNSARRAGPSLDWSLGRLSHGQIEQAGRTLRSAANSLKIVALHHPVTPAPGRAGAAVVARADIALDAFAQAGADLVLTGHAHIAQTRLLNVNGRTLISAAAGTASSTRLRGETPSFNLIAWDENRLTIATHRYSATGYERAGDETFVRGADGWAGQS